MGGIGSGRRDHSGAKNTTNHYRHIDVRTWRREDLLDPQQAFVWQWQRHGEVVASIQVRTETDRLILFYRHSSRSSDWEDKRYPVYLDWTKCHLGGKRPWFLCPAPGCGRRVAILYSGAIFACRQCCQLAYASQRETRGDRAIRRADRIRHKLDWDPGVLNGSGWKPKRMHWRTFHRLTAQHDGLVQKSLRDLALKLDLLGD